MQKGNRFSKALVEDSDDSFTVVKSKRKSRFSNLNDADEVNGNSQTVNNNQLVTNGQTVNDSQLVTNGQTVNNSQINYSQIATTIKRKPKTPKIPEVNINNTVLFPSLTKKENTIDKPKTVWNTFKPTQLDTTIVPINILSSLIPEPKKVEPEKTKAPNSDDSDYMEEEDYDEDEEEEEEDNSTWLDVLSERQNEIVDKLEELENTYRKDTYQYRMLEVKLADVNHEIDEYIYYEEKRLSDCMYIGLESIDECKKRKEKEKEAEMRERQARIDIIGYDDYDQFLLKLEEDLAKLRKWKLKL